MSVTNTKAKSVYNANGTTIEWNLGFTYDDTVSNVHIYIVDTNDNETEVTSNYSISDGVLTYPTTDSGLEPLAEGNKLVIVRDTPRTQDIELTSNGKLDGKVLEGGYDKLTLQVQELTEQVNRAIKFPVTEDSADNFLDPITAITEAKKEALVEIAQATTPAEVAKDTAVAKAQVATEQATIATNAATSAKAAQVGAEQAEQNATAQAEKAETAVTAFVEGLGTAKNAVIDLGTFDGKKSVTSSRIIDFSNTPIAVSLRFSDTNKKLWINGTNSTVGIEVVDNAHCNLFYSIASADFVGLHAGKGPFVVQAIIQYSLLDNSATETEMGAVKLATKAEAEAGTNDTKAMTPLKTKYAIEANAMVQTLRNDVAVIEGKIPQAASETNQLADKKFVQDLTSALNFVQWVDTLPETGESKYIYAVPREETDTDGKQIAALYLWDGSAWRGAGAFSLNIDPDTLATKTELAGYLPLASKAVANGVASLDENAKIPSEQLTVATTSTLGGVKPDGTTITVTEDGTISATGGSGSGSGFDFEGTKAEFDAAVAAGTITADSVSLITDDVDGANVATKAELQAVDSSKVAKSGDTMTGPLKMSGANQIRFGTDDSYFFITNDTNSGNFLIYNNNGKGLFLQTGEAHEPFYWNGTNAYRLLTTADLSSNAGSKIQGAVNYSAQVSITSPFTCPTGGAIGFRCLRGDWNTLDLKINNIQVFYRDGGEYSGASQSMFATVSAGDVISWTGAPSAALFWPAK